MSKVRLKDVTKELNQKAGIILAETERLKRNADILAQMLRQQESQFLRQEEEERQRLRFEQHQQMMQQQTKAWTMPDDEVVPVEVVDTAQPVVEVTPVPAAEKPVEAVAETTKPAAKAESVEEKAAPQAETVESKPPITEPVPAPAEPAATMSAKDPEPVQEAPAKVAVPVPVQQPAARSAAVTQQLARPIQGGPPYGRPAPGAQQYGRPAPGAQQYGRPAPGAQQYGRPATGTQQYGRPASGAQQYGRPAPGAQQNGRPASGGQQYGRPAPGQSQRRSAQSGSRSGAARRPMPMDDPPMHLEKERVSNYDPNKKNYTRQHDPEHVSRNRRQLARSNFSNYDDDVVRGGKRSRAKKPSAQQMMAPIRIEKAYMTAETITVKDLTERIGRPAGEILKKLLLLGNLANINSELDYDTASLVCSEFGVELEMQIAKTAEDALSEIVYEDQEKDLQPRPPVITIMGHVDHGKTSLLDYIRKAHVTTTEAGGITQHIGAYSVSIKGQRITFLDTPGHEAFTAMRARGAQATDIAVLVVAADDGVMPQTVEALNHAKAANVPIIVAINKMDKPTANPERIKQDLTNYELVTEEWGGDTIMVPVSAHTGEGVEQLLEMILLQAEVLQLRANPDRKAQGVIIEAKLDKSRGPLATVLLQNGTLRVGDSIIAGMASGRVRALQNDRGERVQSAGPSMPVEISGFTDVPLAGDEMIAVEDDRLIRAVAEERRDRDREQRVSAGSKVTLDNLFDSISEGKVETLNIIVKADVQGSVEAVRQALEKLSNDQVKIRVLHAGVGAITKDDVNLASAFGALIIGFNIRPDSNARDMAEKEEVDVRLYRVIYQAIEDIEKAMKGMLEPVFKENLLGQAEVRNTFRITGAGTIAGCYVTEGKMQRNASVRLLRDNVVVFEGKLASLRRFKDDVKEVASGYECGIGLEGYNDIKEKDVIECFVMEEIEGKESGRA
jgi:translation initiation factor IF-2